jgi:nucleotide-binding universal stress UspA family protein
LNPEGSRGILGEGTPMPEAGRNYERILVPVDFSPASAAALVYASSLGSASGAVVDALHVWRTNTETPIHLARERVKQNLTDFLEALTLPEGCQVRKRADYGDPYLTILQIAQLSGFDLLVCVAPRPGRAGPHHIGLSLLGATRLPVLLVPHAWVEVRREPDLHRHLRRVLLPAAFGGRALHAVDRVLALARAFDAKVESVFVDDPAASSDQERFSVHLEARGVLGSELIERRDLHGELSAALALRAEQGGYDLFLALEQGGGIQGGGSGSLARRLMALQRCPTLCERPHGGLG